LRCSLRRWYRGQYVAIKSAILSNDRKEFLKEAMVMQGLQHPNILKLLGVVEEGDAVYIVVEFMDGKDLHHVLYKEKKKFTNEEKIRICQKIVEAVDFLHKQRPVVIHRDLKPHNVLYGKNGGDIKLGDFGLTRAMKGTHLTKMGFEQGTPNYTVRSCLAKTMNIGALYEVTT
jgi:serine/threonine protein kinase